MELTLDDYLAEFDRWKARAAGKRQARVDANQPAVSDESLIRMEKTSGQLLPRQAPGETPRTRLSSPGEPAAPGEPTDPPDPS